MAPGQARLTGICSSVASAWRSAASRMSWERTGVFSLVMSTFPQTLSLQLLITAVLVSGFLPTSVTLRVHKPLAPPVAAL